MLCQSFQVFVNVVFAVYSFAFFRLFAVCCTCVKLDFKSGTFFRQMSENAILSTSFKMKLFDKLHEIIFFFFRKTLATNKKRQKSLTETAETDKK